jgi:tetratricopeptide (TPR) repeat protein
MSWQLWPKTDDKGLARYVLPEAASGLKIPKLPDRVSQDPATRLALVEAIYAALVEQGITYRTEDYQPDVGRQSVRHPNDVLGGPKVGTCLDLAVLFCGIALWHDLLPILVVLDGHAFAAVSLKHNRRDWESRTRTERALFVDGVLRGDGAKAATDLFQFFSESDGTFLPIECTGFSRSVDLSDAVPEGRGREGGLLPFERAVTAAREHLSDERKLLFAIDVAALHFSGYQPPPPWAEATGRADVRVYAGAGGQRADYRLETADIVQYQAARFVGREAELKMICDFADGSGPFADRSYLLIEARGGLGKSALMANLVLRATTGQWLGRAPHVIYFFVRRQGGRNTPDAFLRAINSQVLTHLGISGGTPVSLPELKAQFTELWAAIETAAVPESPLVVLIDGLDEMAFPAGDGKETIADVLPAPVNPAIRVVVSSRPQPSARERVRREHPLQAAGLLALRTFDVPGVQLLLEKVIATVKPAERAGSLSADRVATVSKRVFALTGGEPLFARFVCEQLVREGVQQLDALERNPPRDAEDYFRGELKTLRESDVSEEAWEILGMLCVAAGPLSREELAGILQKPPRRITKPLDAVARYLLGERRFELMHPRLREAVTGEFSRDELEAANRRMLEWCASYRARGWPPDTPEYMLDYYAAHLAAVGDRAGLFALIDRRWMLRHRSRDDKSTLTEFIRDVSRATTTALQAPTRDWMAAFRGTYVLATVRSLASSLPPPLIAFLARAGETAEALSYAELVENPVQRCEVFARLAAVALSQQNDREARRLADAALAALTGPREPWGMLDAAYEPLCEVFIGLRDLEGLATALAVAEKLGQDPWCAGAVALVAEAYSRLGHQDRTHTLVFAHPTWDLFLDRVLDLAFQRNDFNLLNAIWALGNQDRTAGQLGRRAAASRALGDRVGAEALAREAIRAINPLVLLGSWWAPMLRHFSRSGMAKQFKKVRSGAVNKILEQLRTGFSGISADVVTALGEVHDVECLAMIRSAVGTNGYQDRFLEEVLCALAEAFARVGDTERATEAARALESEESDGRYEAIAWVRMVKGYCASNLVDSALSAALANTYETRADALAAVVDAMSARGDDPSNVMPLARRTIAEVSVMSGELSQAEAYAELAGVLSQRGDRARGQRLLDRAESELSSISPGGMVIGTARSLAYAHAKLGAFERASERFKSSMDAKSLMTFVELMRPSGRADLVNGLEQRLQDLFSTNDVRALLVAADMARSAGNLEDARAWLEKARELAREDHFGFARLCEVAKAMASAGETTASKEVLQELRQTPEWDLLVNMRASRRPRRFGEAMPMKTGDEDPDASIPSPDEHPRDEDTEEVTVSVWDAVALSEALLAIGEATQGRQMLLRAWSMAREGGYSGSCEVFVRLFSESGALREHYAEIVAVGEKPTHDWEKAQLLGAAARVSIECGDAATGVEFLSRGLEWAASGGRSAFFELVSQFATGFSFLDVPDFEWRLFEMCEEVDSWWGVSSTTPDPA